MVAPSTARTGAIEMSASSPFSAEMYERHYDELRRAARRICRDPDTADDLVHEAFARLIVEVDAGRAPDNGAAWLHRVIANAGVSIARKAASQRRYAPVLAARGVSEPPDAAVVGRELHAEVDALLAGVPSEARTALVLAASGYSGREIAATIGRTPLATRSMLSRSRARLRAQLEASAGGRAAWLEPVA